MKKRAFMIFSALLFVMYILSRVWVFHYLAISGEKLGNLQAETASLTDSITILEEKIEDAGRLQSILAKAKKIGFSKQNKVLSFGSQTEVVLGYQGQNNLFGF